jgi:predicted ABC-type ATPase
VREGGHNIPELVIRRRYEGGLQQFFTAYCTAVDSWSFIDNSDGAGQLIAAGAAGEIVVANSFLWQQLMAAYHV